MKRIVRSGMFALACVFMQGAWAQQNGAPPGNASSQEGASGKSAGVAGGAGAAGQSGTDPATLRRSEEARLQKQHGGVANGASSAGKTARKDWKE